MHMTLDCDAKGLGWLRSLKHFVEESMLLNMLRAALHVINFIADVATGAPGAAAFWEMQDEVRSLQGSYCACPLQLLGLICILYRQIILPLCQRWPVFIRALTRLLARLAISGTDQAEHACWVHVITVHSCGCDLRCAAPAHRQSTALSA